LAAADGFARFISTGITGVIPCKREIMPPFWWPERNNVMKILINAKLQPEQRQKIQAGFPGAQLVMAAAPTEAEAQLDGAEVLVSWWSNFNPTLASHPDLRWIHTLTAGIDGFLLPRVLEGEVLLSNSRGIHGIPMAEHVFAMMLSFSRRIKAYSLQQEQAVWERGPSPGELYGKTMGIVGLGSIGSELARRASVFGMRVVAVKRNPGHPSEGVTRVMGLAGLDMLLKESDFVVLMVPLTSETQGLIGQRELALMKPDAVLINVARGEVVDERALEQALTQRIIAGAALDVFEQEPLNQNSPLWGLPNCLITPHVAAMSPMYLDRALDLFCRNLEAYGQGKPLPTQVDPGRGY